MTRARLTDGSLSEPAFQSQVLALARFYGWRDFHAPDNKPTMTRGGRVVRQRVTPGFPDLVLVRDVELLFVELKAQKGRLGPGQRDWLDDLGLVSAAVTFAIEQSWPEEKQPVPAVEVHLWRPSDWDQIQARLARGKVLQPHTLGVGSVA